MTYKLTVTTLALTAITSTVAATHTKPDTEHPHIVLILCDDMGFSDLSCYGGEIHTPNIDYLAEQGIRFSQFKNTGRSCPSRAALLTGHYQHEAGMGWMTAVDEHRPGYRGQLSDHLPTLAEVLRDQGYATYMSGKWHVTLDAAFETPNGSYPVQRGFDKYYGCLHGGGSYYKPDPVYHNLQRITEFPDDYYYTTAITDSAVSFIKQHPTQTPMFMYIAHYAPHLPLQAPQDKIDACRERYKAGYDVLRQQRFERQKALGLITPEMVLPVFQKEFPDGKRPAWTELTPQQQEKWITDMATYAAMIEIMDSGIGKVIQTLKDKGMYEHTLFLFMSDNGSTSEGGFIKQLMADLSNTPYRSYKQWVFQGGTSSPLILTDGRSKSQTEKGSICREPSHIIDIFPTCLDIASAHYPDTFHNQKVKLAGTSLLPAIRKQKIQPRDLFFEHQISCAILSDGWKLVRANGRQPWELIHLTTDPFETQDLSEQFPLKAKELENKWTRWAEQQHVYPFEYRPWTERINYYQSLYPDQKGKEN